MCEAIDIDMVLKLVNQAASESRGRALDKVEVPEHWMTFNAEREGINVVCRRIRKLVRAQRDS